MVCTNCKNQKHGLCRGGTWCPCQHRADSRNTNEQIAASQPEEQK